jgi:hypothetical protein
MIRHLTFVLALLAAAPAYGQIPPNWSPVVPTPGWWNADIDKGSASTRTVIYDDQGGNLNFYSARWRALANSGSEVEIRGACMSACTTIMVYVPHDKLCFGKEASLTFHMLKDQATGKPAVGAAKWMLDEFPEGIRTWIENKGGVEKMTMEAWTLTAPELWAMGYRRCEPQSPTERKENAQERENKLWELKTGQTTTP